MLNRLSKIPGMPPPMEGVHERVRFSGMQDSSLVVQEGDAAWCAFEEYNAGNLCLDTDNFPDLINSNNPQAQRVLKALRKLGAFDD